MRAFLRGLPHAAVCSVRFWLFGPQTSIEPIIEPESPDEVQSLVRHVHQWGACKWNGQYWYSRCIAAEWCTARRAC